MSHLTESLKEVVKDYATYDEALKAYVSKEDLLISDEMLAAPDVASQQSVTSIKIRLQKIEAQLLTIFSQYLLEKEKKAGETTTKAFQEEIPELTLEEKALLISKNQKKLRSLFHTDKLPNASDEIKWLEYALSQGKNDGYCFKLVDICADELKKSLQDPGYGNSPRYEKSYSKVRDMDGLLAELRDRSSTSTTLTQSAVMDSLISMLESVQKFHQTTGKMPKGWLQTALKTMPYITSGFCIGLYINELALLYALTYSISLGGRWMEQSNDIRWCILSKVMTNFSSVIASAALALTSYVIKLNFALVNHTYYIGVETCSIVYKAITMSPRKLPRTTSSSSSSTLSTPDLDMPCTDLILAPQSLLPGKSFETLELKLLAMNFEAYQAKQQRQWLADWRFGWKKSRVMECTLVKLLDIDRSDLDLPEKLKQARLAIQELEKNKKINVPGTHAGVAIDFSKSMLRNLWEQTPGIEPYEKPSLRLEFDAAALFS